MHSEAQKRLAAWLDWCKSHDFEMAAFQEVVMMRFWESGEWPPEDRFFDADWPFWDERWVNLDSTEKFYLENEANKTTQTLCNLCGLTCNFSDVDNLHHPHGLIDCKVAGGWDSTPGNGYGALDDLDQYQFSLCEFCLDWLMSKMKIKPKVTSVAGGSGGYVEFRPATERVMQDDWRKMKAEFIAAKRERDDARGLK